jgi:outer membrane protein assembly factor BamB
MQYSTVLFLSLKLTRSKFVMNGPLTGNRMREKLTRVFRRLISFDKKSRTAHFPFLLPPLTLLGVMIACSGAFITGLVTITARATHGMQHTASHDQTLLPLVTRASANDWPMLAANPQRTSWTPEEVRGDADGHYTIDWYHPIEPYIPYKIQPIAANGKIYVSTARGLYAFQASDGDLVWVYPTELPLGNSPTIASVNGRSIAYVGGYDRKIHAIDANSGEDIPGYTAYEALAGFETNPLVINNRIYAGNRDGYFYALDARTGNLIWSYPTDGPILFSAAYKNGILYFASNDACAYALDATHGSLVWKSPKFPGEGFASFWPVIYTEKSTGKDYVIFTSGENYQQRVLSLTADESETLLGDLPVGSLIGPTSTSIPGAWVAGTLVIDASRITNYYENRPDRRTVFVLDSTTGQELTFDSDGDGKLEYAPFSWSGVTQSGSKYPPVINGIDGVYYQDTVYIASGSAFARGGPVGWKFGTQYVSRVHTGNNLGSTIGHALDEPMAYSSGGRLIYWSLCCDRESGSYDVTIPFNQPNRDWYTFGYLANWLTGYQPMYNGGDPTAYNNMDGWQVYSGKDESKNGVYGKHGTTQSPPIPYQGKLYYLRGNSLLAFSPSGANPRSPLPLATIVPTQSTSTPPAKSALTQRLENEVQKMLAAGPLRPGYFPAGMIDWYTASGNNSAEYGEIFDYFQNPADTVYTLLLAYPYLSASTQQGVKTYLQANYAPGAKYDFTNIVHLGWGTGAAREVYDIPIEVREQWGDNYRYPFDPSTHPLCGSCGYWQQFPPFSFYAAWKYAQVVGNNAPAFAKTIFDQISSKLESPLSDSTFIEKPYWLNLYIAGYQGYLELQKLAGYQQDQSKLTAYQHLLDLRVNNFSKDTPFPPIGGDSGDVYYNTLAVARNFMFLTPELADYLNQHIYPQVQSALSEYNYVAPYWFVSKFDDSYGEGTFQHLYDCPALFQAKAWILKQPYDELVKWLDVPAFYRGDLFYIQNLVAAVSAH